MGGDHHKHHGPEIPEVPDWRIYKVEDVPELLGVQKALASLGLKDPWLRNEVWKYTEFSHPYPPGAQIKNLIFRGFKYGLVAAIITSVIEKTFFGGHGHGHGHEEEHAHH